METLIDLWAHAGSRFAGRTAVIWEEQEFTYAALHREVTAFAAALRRRLAIQPGDRVALVMPNCLHSLVCYLGALWAGAVALPVNVRLKAEEMRFILTDAGPKTVLVHSSVKDVVREAVRDTEPAERVIGVDFADRGVTPLTELMAEGDTIPPANPTPGETAAIIYTSGTTGLPKGAMITHANILFNVQSTIHGHGFCESDRHLLVVPLFHVTGLNTLMPTAFFQGATLIVTARTAPRDLLALIDRWRATTFFAVPTTMILLVQTPNLESYDMASLRLLAYSGAPMPVRTIQRLRALFPGVWLHNFFGLTETTSVTTVLPDRQALVRPESVGVPPPGIELKIVDDAGNALPPGQVGELLVKGPSVVKGYFNRPGATAEAIVDGWLHTGDTAYLDAEGYLFLQGRKKEMILVAGENVYPVEVENVLTQHPAVAEAAVLGEPHPVLGEAVKAVVVLRPGAAAGARELKRHCLRRLATYKVPQRFEFRGALPRNPSGKVVKRLLKE